MILQLEQLDRHRVTGVTRNSATGGVAGKVYDDDIIFASFQPLSGIERNALPESVRDREVYEIYTQADVRAGDRDAGLEADEVTRGGIRYMVVSVDDWDNGLIRHCKAVVSRIGA